MKTRSLFITLTLVLVYGGALLPQGIPADAPPEQVLRVALDLTEDQVIAIQELGDARAAAIEPIMVEIHGLQGQLEDLMVSEAPDPLVVGELVLAIRTLREEIGGHHESFREAFGSLLTSEQTDRVGHIIGIALAHRAAEALRQLGLR